MIKDFANNKYDQNTSTMKSISKLYRLSLSFSYYRQITQNAESELIDSEQTSELGYIGYGSNDDAISNNLGDYNAEEMYIINHKKQMRKILYKYITPKRDSDIESHVHDHTNCFTEYSISYMCGLMMKGYRKTLEIEDLTLPPKIHQLQYLYQLFLDNYIAHKPDISETAENNIENNECINFTFDIWRTILNINRWCLLKIMICAICDCMMQITYVFIFRELIDFLYSDTIPTGWGILWALLIGITQEISYLFSARGWTHSERSAIGTRNLLMALVFRKSLLIPNYVLQDNNTSIGEIVNIMSNDTERIYFMIRNGVAVPGAIVCIFITIFFMVWIVGYESLVGLLVMIALVPTNIYVGRMLAKMKRAALRFTDKRVKFLSEMLNGVKIIKFYAWEEPLDEVIHGIRKQEIKGFKGVYKWRAMLLAVVVNSAYATIVAILAMKIALNKPVNVTEVYLVIAFVSAIRRSLVRLAFINYVISGYVSAKRLQKFFDNRDHKEWIKQNVKKKAKKCKTDKVDSNDEEESKYDVNDDDDGDGDDAEKRILVKMQNCDFQHKPDGVGCTLNMLKNVNLNIYRNELIAIIGSVGSGKTTLMKSILGETQYSKNNNKIDSDFIVYPTKNKKQLNMAWVGQTNFIMNGTIRENILMDLPMQMDDYNKVIQASALMDDLRLFPAGDSTEIGEKGINLSGGQKARVCIARSFYACIYGETRTRNNMVDLLLLDDPLSALDNDVAQVIFKKGVLKLCANTTRIVVLNSHLQFLDYFDRIIVMEYVQDNQIEDGYCNIVEDCDCSINKDNLNILKKKYDALLTQLIQKHDKENKKDNKDRKPSITDTEIEQEREEIIRKLSVVEDDNDDQHTLIDDHLDEEDDKIDIEILQQRKMKKLGKDDFGKKAKLIVKEDRVRGAIVGSSFIEYLDASFPGHGIFVFSALILLYIGSQLFWVFLDLWFSWWGARNSPQEETRWNNLLFNDQDLSNYGWMYVSFGLLFCIFFAAFLRSILLFIICLASSKTFEYNIFNRIIHAPISYFDSTPIGRITNRFSRDLTIIDSEMPLTLDVVAYRIAWFFSYLTVLCIIIPWYLLVLTPSIIGLIKLRKVYISSTRELKRMDGITRSPLYNIFNECVFGLETIRSYKLQQFFINKFEKQLIMNTRCFFDLAFINRWFGVLLEFFIMLQTLFVSVFVIYLKDSMPPNIAALCITYVTSFGGSFQYFVRLTAELETQLTAVERLHSFGKIDQESAHHNDQFKEKHKGMMNNTWPQHGKIEINNLKLRYRNDLPLVLHGINCDISAGSKIGVCGRTGAGKSSIMICLFRIFEPEIDSSINIDGIEIFGDMGLFDLRSNLAIIPQDPTLFSGSLRFNLDPFNKYKEKDIIQALQNVYLWDFFKDKKDEEKDNSNDNNNGIGIYYKISENGSNLSLGQKQLICIARALLKKPKVLLLDEATSSIDFESDQLIQKSIRKNFDKNCTILTIAHRLETIIDSDKILVLDQGKIDQYDTPQNLINDKNGSFYKLWHQT